MSGDIFTPQSQSIMNTTGVGAGTKVPYTTDIMQIPMHSPVTPNIQMSPVTPTTPGVIPPVHSAMFAPPPTTLDTSVEQGGGIMDFLGDTWNSISGGGAGGTGNLFNMSDDSMAMWFGGETAEGRQGAGLLPLGFDIGSGIMDFMAGREAGKRADDYLDIAKQTHKQNLQMFQNALADRATRDRARASQGGAAALAAYDEQNKA